MCCGSKKHTEYEIKGFYWPLPFQFSSVAQSCLTLRPHGLQHVRPPCPSPAPGVYPNSCPLSRWCHPTISSSVFPFSSRLQSFQASGPLQMSQLKSVCDEFTSGGQSIGVSASTSVLPMNTQDWSPLGWTNWISLQSKGFSRVFSNIIVQKHQFFSAQLSLWSLSNSMKLWAMLCRATKDGWIMVESSDKTWSTGEGNGKPLQYSCLENPMNSMKR